MVNIKLEQAQDLNSTQFQKFKVEQSPDRNACIEAIMYIIDNENQPQNSSPNNNYNQYVNQTALSSLSEIRDMHQILSSQNRIEPGKMVS